MVMFVNRIIDDRQSGMELLIETDTLLLDDHRASHGRITNSIPNDHSFESFRHLIILIIILRR